MFIGIVPVEKGCLINNLCIYVLVQLIKSSFKIVHIEVSSYQEMAGKSYLSSDLSFYM